MKVALLADIHANGDALVAVLAAAKREGSDRILFAGDLIGYYYQPSLVLSLMNEWDWTMVRGNHEDLLRDWLAGKGREDVQRRYGSGLAEAASCLTSPQLDALISSPPRRELEIDGRRILLCHGSPWDPDVYVYPDADNEVRHRMVTEGHDLVVFGHTHYPVLWEFDQAKAVNPGSVGQRRDRGFGACWANWDTGSNSISLHRESYDPSNLIAECRQRDPQLQYLADVLERS